MVKVILIDTGLMKDYEDERIIGGCSVVKSSEGYAVQEGYEDFIGHGTAAADVILKHTENVQIYVVRIYEEDWFISEEKLIYALEYVRENLTYDVIQISSGLLTYSGKMHEQIKRIVKDDKKLVISAFDNDGGISYPAALPEVLGIDVDPSYSKKDQYDIVEGGVVDVRGGLAFYRVPWVNVKKNIVKGTSFTTSYFTAWIANHCEDNVTKEYVMERLKENAIRVFPNLARKETISAAQFVKGIRKAITFPFNKEIYCLAAFEDTLPFEVVGYYDIKHKFQVGRKIKEVLTYTDNEAVIQNIDHLDWDGDFDTVILGHVKEIGAVTKTDYLMQILKLCHDHHKKAYVFDDLGLSFRDYQNSEMTYSPIIPADPNLLNHFGKLRTCNVPVLAVLGTSSRQGKYTIQVQLMQEFRKRNVKVDGIATEPTGALFGFSYMFAYGYGSNNTLSDMESLRVLNDLTFRLEAQQNELIITGGQSGTISYDKRNESYIPLSQYAYLNGVNPDGVILCVNEIDDFIYVKRTINFIESATCAKVFAIVISPVHKSDKEQVNNQDLEGQLRAEYGDSVTYYRLQDLDVKKLTDNVMSYYE